MTRIDAAVGSSPPSRGIYAPCRGGFPRRGTIPALAGNTWGRRPRTRRAADHPRSRGEYGRHIIHSTNRTGSSPLSRGIHRSRGRRKRQEGIIPALAGNTAPCWWPSPPWTDHPRSRGEYLILRWTSQQGFGSSPLSRGIPIGAALLRGAPRIIPALAGNTEPLPQPFFVPEDHPRSRGEYGTPSEHTEPVDGSSPLSRGIRAADDDGDEGRGIIPALAGNTGSAAALAVTTRDHPRSRGEYMARCCAQFTESGSSPLSRGIRTGGSDDDQHGRIIPALAGNTPSRCRSSTRHPDHPRSRGEYLWGPRFLGSTEGSSPLSRGIQRQCA